MVKKKTKQKKQRKRTVIDFDCTLIHTKVDRGICCLVLNALLLSFHQG